MIFYFSGTGNSYAVAKQIADRIEGEKVVPLTGFNDFSLCENEERIGITFPCYGGRAPDIVLDFKDKLFKNINKENKYIFTVVTYAHSPVASYLDFKDEVNAWFKVKMPQNDIFGTTALPEKKETYLLESSVKLIDHFADDVLSKKSTIMFRPFPGMRCFTKWAYNHVKNQHKDFGKEIYTDKKCIKCKMCTKCCPVHNITFDNKPIWGTNCINCCGCLNRCPKGAIQVGNKTQDKRRYFHPAFKNVYFTLENSHKYGVNNQTLPNGNK